MLRLPTELVFLIALALSARDELAPSAWLELASRDNSRGEGYESPDSHLTFSSPLWIVTQSLRG